MSTISFLKKTKPLFVLSKLMFQTEFVKFVEEATKNDKKGLR